MNDRYVSLAELPNQLTEENRLAWQFPIHESAADIERIVADTKRIGQAARWAGLSGLVVGAYQGDSDSYTPNAARINPDGTLVGAASARRIKIARQTELGYDNGPVVAPSYTWPTGISV